MSAKDTKITMPAASAAAPAGPKKASKAKLSKLLNPDSKDAKAATRRAAREHETAPDRAPKLKHVIVRIHVEISHTIPDTVTGHCNKVGSIKVKTTR